MSVVSKLAPSISEEEESKPIDFALPLSFVQKRHLEPIEGVKEMTQTWRMKERMKTVSVALVLCLNVGVDPPDIVKTQPCARLECWIDPLATSHQKALESIGNMLQKQYEKWQPRARYKQSLDPTSEEVKKLCTSLRKSAKDERVLFHYNGHGVPKPTTNGEIWVFNKTYTQYIPLSIFDLQAWMGSPSIYVYDCSSAGTIVTSFKQFAEQHEKEYEVSSGQGRGTPGPAPSFKNCIQLGACAANQILPMNPDLPADLFTSCLTTPIKVALRWYVMQSTSKLVPKINLELIDKIPGQLNDRRTMLGELNWIFTAITDTIAWNTLPKDLFQRLFRQDLLVATLFRNFLLAERVMRSYDCTPVSSPKLPSTFQHAMWQAWDLALDLCLAQLPGMLENNEKFQHSLFFEEQLTAFQVWLELGGKERSPPEQLPIVLQVLLSQVHRLRALELLGRFLDLGPWAVNLALSVGIFPYVLKLLQSSARELRPLLVFIWAKILAVDNTCQADLLRDNGHKYFISILQDPTMLSEHRTLAAFVLACIVNKFEPGQEAGLQGSLVSICLEQLNDNNPLLRQWVAICLARLWDNYDRARWCGVRDIANEKLYDLLLDHHPEVRAAAVYALGTFISSSSDRTEHANSIDQSVATMLLNKVSQDMSPLVRQQLIVALQWMILLFETSFIPIALSEEGKKESPLSPSIVIVNEATLSPQPTLKRMGSRDRMSKASSGFISNESMMSAVELLPFPAYEKMKRVSSSSSISSLGNESSSRTKSGSSSLPSVAYGTIYMKLWHGMQLLEKDPHPTVRKMCHTVLEKVRSQAREIYCSREQESRASSVSLPPSPSSRTSSLTSESPPSSLTNSASELNRLTPRSAGHVTARLRRLPNTISEESDEASNPKKQIVTTQFVAWRCKHFAQPVMKVFDDSDIESKSYYEREWRYLRNDALRHEAELEHKKTPRLEHEAFNSRSAETPKVIMFHPFDTHLVVAAKDSYGIWDWNSGSRVCYVGNRGRKGSRITSLQWVNAHDITLLLTGSDDGSARLWSNYLMRDGKDPDLRTAWQAIPDLATSSRAINGSVGMVMSWDQKGQQLVAGGDSSKIRVWDAEKELKLTELATGTESSVTSVSTDSYNNYLLAAGCGDGSVRLFDRRLPSQDARVATWREHSAWVVGVHLSFIPQGNGRIISGCVAGDVRVFDIRRQSSLSTSQTSQGMTAMAVHDIADFFCCGSVNHFVSVYRKDGNQLNVIKYHEGFMGARMGPVSCLAVHPYRVALASGNVDGNISVYTLDNRR